MLADKGNISQDLASVNPIPQEKKKLSILFESLPVVASTHLAPFKVPHPNIKAISTWLFSDQIMDALEEVGYFTKVCRLRKNYKFNYGHISLGTDGWKKFLHMGYYQTINFLFFLWDSGILIPVCTVTHEHRPYYQRNWVWRFSEHVLKVTPNNIIKAGKAYPYSRSRITHNARAT